MAVPTRNSVCCTWCHDMSWLKPWGLAKTHGRLAAWPGDLPICKFRPKTCCQGHQAAQKRHSPLKAKSSSRCHCTRLTSFTCIMCFANAEFLCVAIWCQWRCTVAWAKQNSIWIIQLVGLSRRTKANSWKQRLKAAFFLQIAAESKATRGYKTLTGRLRGLCGRRLRDATKETREATQRLRGCRATRASSFQIKTNVAGMARMARMARGGETIRTRFDRRALASAEGSVALRERFQLGLLACAWS